jgi:hypothetical protein
MLQTKKTPVEAFIYKGVLISMGITRNFGTNTNKLLIL